MVVLLISKSDWQEKATCESPGVVRFHENVPRECVEYILWDDRIELLGPRKAGRPRPWLERVCGRGRQGRGGIRRFSLGASPTQG